MTNRETPAPNKNNPAIRRTSDSNGSCAVIEGNFVKIARLITRDHTPYYSADIRAFPEDRNTQRMNFRTLEQALSWAAGAAAEHQGKPEAGQIVHWESFNCWSITVAETENGNFRFEICPMWHDNYPKLSREQGICVSVDYAVRAARSQISAQDEQQEQDRIEQYRIETELRKRVDLRTMSSLLAPRAAKPAQGE